MAIGVTVIVGVAMTTSLTVEIVATISDCCALVGFEQLCDKEDKFYKLSREVDDLSESIDAIWTNGKQKHFSVRYKFYHIRVSLTMRKICNTDSKKI